MKRRPRLRVPAALPRRWLGEWRAMLAAIREAA
jgi:hypothetical protein